MSSANSEKALATGEKPLSLRPYSGYQPEAAVFQGRNVISTHSNSRFTARTFLSKNDLGSIKTTKVINIHMGKRGFLANH